MSIPQQIPCHISHTLNAMAFWRFGAANLARASKNPTPASGGPGWPRNTLQSAVSRPRVLTRRVDAQGSMRRKPPESSVAARAAQPIATRQTAHLSTIHTRGTKQQELSAFHWHRACGVRTYAQPIDRSEGQVRPDADDSQGFARLYGRHCCRHGAAPVAGPHIAPDGLAFDILVPQTGA